MSLPFSGTITSLSNEPEPDGSFFQGESSQLLAFAFASANKFDIGILDLETRQWKRLTDDGWDQWGPEFSPDGRWIAYSAIRNGNKEVWIKPYPDGLGKPIADGTEPSWGPQSESGHYELYFRNETHMMKVSLTGDTDLDISTPEPVFPDIYLKAEFPRARNYDIAKDGRFLMVKVIDNQLPPLTELNIVINWHKELEGLWP